MGGKGSGGSRLGSGRKILYPNDEIKKITVTLPAALIDHFEVIGNKNISQGITLETEEQFKARPVIKRQEKMEGRRLTKIYVPLKPRDETDPWGNYGYQSLSEISLEPGSEFYVIEVSHLLNKWPDHFTLQPKPGRTNDSREERVYGWLGTTNDIHEFALGKYRLDAFEETKTKIVLHITRIE